MATVASRNPIINALARGRQEAIEEHQLAQDAEAFEQEKKLNEQRLKQFEQELRTAEEQDKRTLGTQKFQARELVRQALLGTGGAQNIAGIGPTTMGPVEPQMLPQVTGELAVPGMPQQIAPLQVAEGPLGQETFTGQEILSGTRARRSAQEEALANIQEEAIAKELPRLRREEIIQEARNEGLETVARIRAASVESPESKQARALALEKAKQANRRNLLLLKNALDIKSEKESGEVEALADNFYWGLQAPGKDKASLKALKILSEPTAQFPQGRKVLPPPVRKDLSSFAPLVNLLTTVKDFVSDNPNAFPTSTILPAKISKATSGRATKLTEVGTRFDTITARAGQVASAISNESGRFTEGDINRALQGLPEVGDTSAIAQEKIKLVEKDLETIVNSLLLGIPEAQKRDIVDAIFAASEEDIVPDLDKKSAIGAEPTKAEIEQFMLQTGADRKTAIQFLQEE